ncbi:MAG: NIF3-like protein [Candidatus Doudnabacteria bacterium]|nr:NIF3-like protein [Candidatus Doudnabacteria bacterium]
MKEFVKIVVFVPETHADVLRQSIGEAGAGKIGNYTFCSFSTKGIGRFKPEQGADPAIGEVGKLEAVAEERVEVACERDQVEGLIKAIKAVHPYEEVVIDIYPMLVLEND